jgi:hypothetical protein
VAAPPPSAPSQPQVTVQVSQPQYSERGRGASGFGVAALVLGIVAIVISFIPCVGIFAAVPAVFGVIMGIVGLIVGMTGRGGIGMPIAGLLLSILAVAWPILFVLVFAGSLAGILGAMGAASAASGSSSPFRGPSGSLPASSSRPAWVSQATPVANAPRVPAPPVPTRDPWISTIEKRIAQMERQAGRIANDSLWATLNELRQDIEQHKDTPAYSQYHTRLDGVITVGLEAAMQQCYQSALTMYNQRNLRGALTQCNQAREILRAPNLPRYFVTAPPQEWRGLKQAVELEQKISGSDLSIRYSLVQVLYTSKGVAAKLRDNLSMQTIDVVPGGSIGTTTVESVDGRSQTVVLRSAHGRFQIRR